VGKPVARLEVDPLIESIDGFAGAGACLMKLCRLGWVEQVQMRGNRRWYKPSNRAIRAVLAWSGREERAA
jgi:hypothetical protein